MQTITQDKTVYIGPERRTGQDRRDSVGRRPSWDERRSGADRRQTALSGVVAGLSAQQMMLLRELYETVEERQDHGRD